MHFFPPLRLSLRSEGCEKLFWSVFWGGGGVGRRVEVGRWGWGGAGMAAMAAAVVK